ncbi:uncharacterized protein LOC105172662 [Sesamum indicum]|uniref:Uncharacterized protein LOC105172662 n=1 Tax=Sesamum indicum TaxID=4182 RepID=A0A6I9U615_SESIN|nr:uncharacterized protein LOC105172662 [Sesamum indicum]
MELPTTLKNPLPSFPPPRTPIKIPINNYTLPSSPNPITPKTHLKTNPYEPPTPTMSDILAASRAQNLDLQLQTFGPFFRVTARSLGTRRELGRAEGVIRFWFGGKILHLDSMKLRRETVGMEKSIFGIGLFVGAVAIRHGFECGCRKAELLAINDTHLYHSKLVRFYKRIGFREVYEVTGSSLGDFTHMLVWGGVGTRMDADLHHLITKWCSRFKPKSTVDAA